MHLSILFKIPVWELMQQWTSAQFALYRAYDQVEPITPDREDTRHALLAHLVANGLGGGKGRTWKVEDFSAGGWTRAERYWRRKRESKRGGGEKSDAGLALRNHLLSMTVLSGGTVERPDGDDRQSVSQHQGEDERIPEGDRPGEAQAP